MGQQSSIPTDLSRELRVIGAGMSRTGTVSFSMALERLLNGAVCHSGTAILTREEAFVKKWIEIQQPSANDDIIENGLRELTAGYVAITDCPALAFTEELVRMYPNAMVICTTRDPESWWRSFQALTKNTSLWWLNVVFFPVGTLRWFGVWSRGIGGRMDMLYNCPEEDKKSPRGLKYHEDYVRRVVPPERLFFFDVKEGWEPLCKILNCPVPDEPFPRANDANAMEEAFKKLLGMALLRWLQIFAVSGVALGMGVWGWRGR